MPDTGWFSSPFFNDNKQRLSVTYKYDSLYRETERVFGNGVVQKTQYTVTGQTELITEVNSRGELLRAEGYVYDEGGRRIYTISEKGELTSYTYDTQSRLSKVLYSYTDEKKEADKIEAEEEDVHYLEGNVKPVNVFLTLEDKAVIVPLLEKIGWGRSSYLTTTQVLWPETYNYDANGNRASKTTPFGTIRYWYDKENRLVHSGSDEGRGSDYTYDANGNLLSKTNLYKTEEYSYTGNNRMSMSTVTDHIKKTKTITHYDYDAFGRRTLVQDEGGKIIRTLYDGLSFDIIREQETFADGYFTNTSDTGIAWSPVSEGDGSRYRYIGDDAPAAQEQNGYSVTATNRSSSRVALYAKGQAVGVTRSSNYASSERSYFGTDLMGTVRSATTDSGNAEYYEYDVFGKPYGESVSDYAYTGKPYDPTTGMYNYGYRDYVPQTARFTTIDPIRDGNNWFAYCNNEPVNFLDAWGLSASDAGQWERSGGFKNTYGNNPISKDPYSHNGEDWKWMVNGENKTVGKEVTSLTKGKVIGAEQDPKNAKGADPNNKGNWVRVQGEDGVITDYYHLDSVNVKKGDEVTTDTVIGKAGNTGGSTGPHLHIDQYTATKPDDYDTNQDAYLKKSYDGGNTFIYFRDPIDL